MRSGPLYSPAHKKYSTLIWAYMVLETVGSTPFLVGQVLLGSFFVLKGFDHFTQQDLLLRYAKYKNIPYPQYLIPVAGVLLLASGLSIMTGVYSRISVGVLALSFLGATPVIHNFWAIRDLGRREAERTHFLKNMAVVSCLLMLLTVNQWQSLLWL